MPEPEAPHDLSLQFPDGWFSIGIKDDLISVSLVSKWNWIYSGIQ